MKQILIILIILLSQPASAGLFGHPPPQPALSQAVELGNIKYVKKLIKQGHSINFIDSNGQTALMRAAFHGNEKMIKTLIRYGADINIANNKGYTALHLAVRNGHEAATKTLVKYGANLELVDKAGLTALQQAVKMGNIEVIKAIDPTAITAVSTETSLTSIVVAGAGGITKTHIIVAGAGAAAAGAGVAVASSSSSSGNETPSSGGSGSGGSGGGGSGTDIFARERSNQSGLAQINASVAYDAGYTGSGIKVAVVDTGVDLDHWELDGNLAGSGAHFYGDGASTGVNGDYSLWHGTHVAGIIAAERNGFGIHGVAYNAKILPVNVYTEADDSLYEADIVRGIDYSIAQNADIINLSLGGSDVSGISGIDPFPNITDAIERAMDADILVFAATGNSGGSDPIWPAQNAKELNDDATVGIDTGAIIAVGSVNSNNIISSFSNECGTAQDWCLVAPGASIVSTVPAGTFPPPDEEDQFGVASGTSMATPHVSGAAAVLLSRFASSGATPRQVAQRLLNSATDLGDPGVDDVYGHGLLNLNGAIAPLGTTVIPLGNNIGDSSIPLAGSSITTASAFGDAISSQNLQFTMLDSYKWAYNVNLQSVTYNNGNFTSFNDMLFEFGGELQDKIDITDNTSLAITDISNKKWSAAEDDIEHNARISFSSKYDNGQMSVNYNVPMAQSFNPTVLGGAQRLSAQTMDSNSHLGFVETDLSQITSYNLSKKTSLRFGSFHSKQDDGDIYGVVNEYGYNAGFAATNLQIGMMSEEKTFLGGVNKGAFSLQQNTPTWFSNISADIPLSKNISLFGSYNYGISYPKAAAESLFDSISQIQSRSFSAGLGKTATLYNNDRLDFIVSQPLMVVSGSANLDLPQSRDAAGNVYRNNYNINLSPSGREIDYGLFYSVHGEDESLSIGSIYRTQPGHDRYAEDDALVLMKYDVRF